MLLYIAVLQLIPKEIYDDVFCPIQSKHFKSNFKFQMKDVNLI